MTVSRDLRWLRCPAMLMLPWWPTVCWPTGIVRRRLRISLAVAKPMGGLRWNSGRLGLILRRKRRLLVLAQRLDRPPGGALLLRWTRHIAFGSPLGLGWRHGRRKATLRP